MLLLHVHVDMLLACFICLRETMNGHSKQRRAENVRSPSTSPTGGEVPMQWGQLVGMHACNGLVLGLSAHPRMARAQL